MCFQGAEDCLHLNVFTPQLTQPLSADQSATGYPVLVWLHGGAFSHGSSSPRSHGPERLLDKDLVVVSLNYRLGALGFLTTEDAAAPPNLGLRDQQLALAWVHQHIAAFGGDPARVTLGGQAAGGTSVMAHLAAPSSAGLFQQAIAMSGVWGFHPFLHAARGGLRRYAALLAADLGCDLDEDQASEAIAACLRRQDVGSLVQAASQFSLYDNLPMAFKPMADSFMADPLLPDNPWWTGPRQDVPLMIGATKDEGIVSLLPFLQNETLYELVSADFATEGPVLLFGSEPTQVGLNVTIFSLPFFKEYKTKNIYDLLLEVKSKRKSSQVVKMLRFLYPGGRERARG